MTSNNTPSMPEFRNRFAWSTLWIYPLAIVLLCAVLSSCTKDHIDPVPPPGGGNASPSPSASPTPYIDENAVNVVKFGVNDYSYCSAGSYTNKPCAKITICDAANNCQEVKDVLIDTGSYGLRVFKQRISNLNLSASGAGNIAECMEYGDGSRQWGPIKTAKVKMGNEPAVTVPIQVIDATFPGMDEQCSGAEKYPDQGDTDEYAGMSGILGIGVFVSDCGPYCQTSADNNVYFSCSGATCTSTAVSEANQVQNPIAHLPVDNNGVIIKLPGVPANGVASTLGYMIFGIGTRNNNVPGTVSAFRVDPNYGEFTATYLGADYNSFIDTGSNALGIPANRDLPDCGGDLAGWLCPSGTISQTATLRGENGVGFQAINFKVGNFRSLYGTGNAVFSESAYASGGNIAGYFDWGLPFYFNRTVYHGFEQKSSQLGAGPLWAW